MNNCTLFQAEETLAVCCEMLFGADPAPVLEAPCVKGSKKVKALTAEVADQVLDMCACSSYEIESWDVHRFLRHNAIKAGTRGSYR